MRTRKTLRMYQARAAMRIVQDKRLGLFVDISLGKTAITLTAIRNLIDLGRLARGALVIAPISVTKDTWQEEAKLWSHLSNLKMILIEGKPAARLRLLKEPADVHIISYTLLPWIGKILHPKKIRRVKGKLQRPEWIPDMLVLDESENVKGRGKWFRVVRYCLIKWMQYRVIQTGTPSAHSLFDLWSQMFVIDKGNRLGTAFDRFRSRFFTQSDWGGYKYEPRSGAEQRIYSLIGDAVVRLDGKDWLELPEIVQDTVFVDLPPRAMRLYKNHERDMFTKLDNMKEVEAVNAAVLSGQCWQFANGAIYDDPEERDSWTEVHTVKLDALRVMIDQAVGNPILIPYWFRHDRYRLQREYPKAVFMNKDNVTEVKALWNNGKLPLVFLNPQSVSHGLNMQFGGHMIIWFAQIWSGGKHDQVIGRLRRPDQKSPHIISRYITARNTVDEVIQESRNNRLRGQAALLDALRRYRRRHE